MGKKRQGQGPKGSKGRKVGRKARKFAFQRYKVSDRFMRGIKRHVRENKNDTHAKETLEKMLDAGSWLKWREVRKRRRMAA